MRLLVFVISLNILSISCNAYQEKPPLPIPFNQEQWLLKNAEDYPFRNRMVPAILQNDSIRSLSKSQIIHLLGTPDMDRNHDDYLYYMISQKRIGSWPMHTKSMVFKFNGTDQIEWIKIHK